MEKNQVVSKQEEVVAFLSELFDQEDLINLRTWGKGTSKNVYINKKNDNYILVAMYSYCFFKHVKRFTKQRSHGKLLFYN